MLRKYKRVMDHFLKRIHSVTCRHRKLKCDEERPICQHCIKSSRDCRYVERAVFRTFDSSALSNGKAKDKVNSGEPFDDNQTWLNIPKNRKKSTRSVY